jgi:hypothetical protein
MHALQDANVAMAQAAYAYATPVAYQGGPAYMPGPPVYGVPVQPGMPHAAPGAPPPGVPQDMKYSSNAGR